VRELQNVIERIVVLNRGSLVQLSDLPANLREAVTEMVFRDMPGTLQDVERVRIADALRESSGNKKLAASRLGIHRSTLYAKIRRYGLDHAEGGVEPDRRAAGQHVPGNATPVSNLQR